MYPDHYCPLDVAVELTGAPVDGVPFEYVDQVPTSYYNIRKPTERMTIQDHTGTSTEEEEEEENASSDQADDDDGDGDYTIGENEESDSDEDDVSEDEDEDEM